MRGNTTIIYDTNGNNFFVMISILFRLIKIILISFDCRFFVFGWNEKSFYSLFCTYLSSYFVLENFVPFSQISSMLEKNINLLFENWICMFMFGVLRLFLVCLPIISSVKSLSLCRKLSLLFIAVQENYSLLITKINYLRFVYYEKIRGIFF